jgi:hypothetical protein
MRRSKCATCRHHGRTSLRARPQYDAEQAAMCGDLRVGGAVLLHFDAAGWRWETPSAEEIGRACGLEVRERFDDEASTRP